MKRALSKNIALIDNDLILYSELGEQQDFFRDYLWQHFNDLVKFNREVRKKCFDLVIFNMPESESKNIERLYPVFFEQSAISRIILSSKKGLKEAKNNFGDVGNLSFLEKPFRFMNLVQLINDKFKAQEISSMLSIVIGPFLLKPFEKVLINEFKQKLLLTDMEVKILRILSTNAGVFIKKETFLNEVWGIKSSLETHTLETHIYRLRKKLNAKFANDLLIRSKTGKYALECKV